MKISNFKLVKVIGENPSTWKFVASIDVTTGFLFFETTEEKIIYRTFGNAWYFGNSGEYLLDNAIFDLVRRYEAVHGKDLEFIEV